MTDTPRAPLSRGRVILATAATALAALLIVLGAILPAEFNRDPLGVGRLSGLSRLWGPEDIQADVTDAAGLRARAYATPWRTDVVEIPLGGFLSGADYSELEYKVALKKDATLIYAWEVVGAKDSRDFRYDFHGHTTPPKGQAITVATWAQASGLRAQGALTAPFDGIQGWQFSNGGDAPVVVRVRLAGFYTLVPPGAPGNEVGIVANVPAAQARPAY